jgi:hypothetical protein
MKRLLTFAFVLSIPFVVACEDDKPEEKSGGLEIKGDEGTIKIGADGIKVDGKDGKVEIGGPGGIKVEGQDGKVEIKGENGKLTVETTDKKAED